MRDDLLMLALEDTLRSMLEAAGRAGYSVGAPVVQVALIEAGTAAHRDMVLSTVGERLLDELRRWRPRSER